MERKKERERNQPILLVEGEKVEEKAGSGWENRKGDMGRREVSQAADSAHHPTLGDKVTRHW